VRKLAVLLGDSPDTATTENLRRFQLHLVDAGTGPVTTNATITGLRFFFDVSLSQPAAMAKMQHVHVPRKLPVIQSPEEVGRLIAAHRIWSTRPRCRWPTAPAVVSGFCLIPKEIEQARPLRLPMRRPCAPHRATAVSPPRKRAPFGNSDDDLAALPDAANIGFG
jgi:hypothetical protein